MTDALAHRGPDAGGLWHDQAGNIFLGHRRLSIMDLSPTGAQPMRSQDGRFVLVYNGEIYNFQDLKLQLAAAGSAFVGTSDTEVFVEAIARWGIMPTLRRINGMFAFAAWDTIEQTLWIGRDRFGEKPLYYTYNSAGFGFASELKALRHLPAFDTTIDAQALACYLRFSYVPSPLSIYRGTYKLPPGCCLCVKPNSPAEMPQPYWQMHEVVSSPRIKLDERELIDRVDTALRRAVGMRMVADVPLGAFLSGGIDSSLIVATMQAQSPRPVRTFTIGFDDASYDESPFARNIARHLGAEHVDVRLTPFECIRTAMRLPAVYDEPFADSSQIPTLLVSQFTRRHVTVALSGDAGDEMWGGYNRYLWPQLLWPKIEPVPFWFRALAAKFIHGLSPRMWDALFTAVRPRLSTGLRAGEFGEKMHKIAGALGARSPDDVYRYVTSNCRNPNELLLNEAPNRLLEEEFARVPSSLGYVERMMYLDARTYMTDDILCKVDRAAMSCGLETRVPYLDNELVALAWSLPPGEKFKDGVGKWPLRQVLKRYVPESLFERPKAGFAIPLGEWLRGEMREWVNDLLSEERLRASAVFNTAAVRELLQQHQTGRNNVQHALWSIAVFQALSAEAR